MTSDGVLLVIKPFAAGICLWFASLLGATPATAEVSCNAWNTMDFFERASAANVSRCLTVGVNVNAKDDHGRRPLHHAAEESETPAAVIPLLMKAGADVNARVGGPVVYAGEGGMTPLHFAAKNSSHAAAAIGALVKAGADVNAGIDTGSCSGARYVDCQCGTTPLHVAAGYDTTGTAVTVLVKAGADVNARTQCGEERPCMMQLTGIRAKRPLPS